MSKSLKFLKTLTVAQLKEEQRSSFRIMAKSSGYWFACGVISGHVSETVDPKSITPQDVLVSEVSTDEGDIFWMVHRVGSAEAIVEW